MCGIVNQIEEEPLNLFTDEELERLAVAIYFGAVTTKTLDVNTYLKIARKLSEGVFHGYGLTISETLAQSQDWLMLTALKKNVYIFSAAKTYQQTREVEKIMRSVSRLLVKEDRITQFNEFKKEAFRILKDYNENYLKAEYYSAISQARTASQWQEIISRKGELKALRYQTVGDGRVRPQHKVLDNVTKLVDDPFWNTFMPPNGWNCRCTVDQVLGEKRTLTRREITVTPNDVPEEFRFNAGKDKIVFSHKHPYFKIAPRDKGWARQNFGLPLP